MAADVIRRIREVADQRIKYVLLSLYHAVRLLGGLDLSARADKLAALHPEKLLSGRWPARQTREQVTADGVRWQVGKVFFKDELTYQFNLLPEDQHKLDPPFHPGQSVLLHKECDGVWRIDFQLGRDADAAEEKMPERVIPRIQAMPGPQAEFELEWVSVYQFACRRMKNFRHGRSLFAGVAVHQVSPFGARGANSGVQDIDRLIWKLAAVIKGEAPDARLDSHHAERAVAADDNICHSTRATDFISPKTRASLRLRDAVLALAKTEPFARLLVNSGRQSMPPPYVDSALLTADEEDAFTGGVAPGCPAVDAPLGGGWRCATRCS